MSCWRMARYPAIVRTMKALEFTQSYLQREPVLFVLAVLGFSYVLRLIAKSRNKLPLPPGPRRLPIIGSLLDVPTVRPWLTYSNWAKQFGRFIAYKFSHLS